MKVDPKSIKLVAKFKDADIATYRYGEYTFKVDREDWHDLEKNGEIPDYASTGIREDLVKRYKEHREVKVSKEKLNRLFVYGIFLGEDGRKAYGMSKPQYDTVPGYLTVGDYIVQAIKIEDQRIRLTGLRVDVDPDYWGKIDDLEAGYDRVKITTTNNQDCWMYVAKGSEE